MDISELKKIVNDGLVKYKAYKEADKALDELLSLSQAESDLKKVVGSLEKQRDVLAVESDGIAKKINAANVKASEIEAEAKAKAEKIVLEGEADLATKKKKLELEISQKIVAIDTQESLLKIAAEKAQKAQAELDAINAELDKAKAKLKGFLGE